MRGKNYDETNRWAEVLRQPTPTLVLTDNRQPDARVELHFWRRDHERMMAGIYTAGGDTAPL